MTNRLSTLTLSALLVWLPGCGAPDASAAADAERVPDAAPTDSERGAAARDADELLGSLEATIDGERMEFFIVAGDIRGQRYASAAWHEPDEDRILLAVGGLDTPSPPLDTFEQGTEGQPVSFGDYDGPVLSLLVELTPEPAPVSLNFPDDDDMSGLVYMSRAAFDDTNAMYLAHSGSLEVSDVSLSGGRMSAEGTFSGTFRSMGTGDEVTIADGRFSVQDVPHLDEITPGSM